MSGRRGAPAPIVLAANHGRIGGGEVMLLQIAEVLRAAHRPVVVLGPAGPDELLEAARSRGLDTLALDGGDRRTYAAALTRWRHRHRAVPLWCAGLLPSLATAGPGPRIVHLHQTPRGKGQRAVVRLARAGADTVLVPSRCTARAVPSSRVLENWTADFPVAVPRTGSADTVRIGMMGRLTEAKGIGDLADALPLIRAGSEEPVRAVIAGEARFAGAGEPDPRTRWGARDAVDLLGWTTPETFFAAVDLVVVPSRQPESFGLVAAEAMAAGVPLVVSDAGALPEVVGAGYPWVFRAGDPRDLARTVLDALAAPPDARSALLTASRARWESRYSPEAGARRVQELLHHLSRQDGHE